MMFAVPHPLLVLAVGITIFAILSPFIFAEKVARRRRILRILGRNWLIATPAHRKLSDATLKNAKQTADELSKQESFDLAARIAARLKAAFAEPEHTRLTHVVEMLNDPRVLNDQLWFDMQIALNDINRRYPKEVEAFVETIMDVCENAIILHAARCIALSGAGHNHRLKAVGEAISGSLIWRTVYNLGQH